MFQYKVSYKDYVCPKCFKQLKKCKCEHRPSYLIHVDYEIQECVELLNRKGYLTRYSCSSHLEEYKRTGFSELYIVLVDWLQLGTDCPKGFKKDKKANTFRYHYPKKLTDEEFTSEKDKQLQHLLDWCRRLPEYTKDSYGREKSEVERERRELAERRAELKKNIVKRKSKELCVI